MATIKILIGLLLLLSGILYFYKPNTVIRLNLILREFVYSDRFVLLYHKKIATILIILSLISLYMGFSETPIKTPKSSEPHPAASYISAMQSYYNNNYREALRHTYRILFYKPNDEWALTHLAYIYAALGEEKKVREISDKILKLYPNNKSVRIFQLNRPIKK